MTKSTDEKFDIIKQRVKNISLVSAMMRDAPDIFDACMAEAADDHEVVRSLVAMMPSKLSPEQRETADRLLAELEEKERIAREMQAKNTAPK